VALQANGQAAAGGAHFFGWARGLLILPATLLRLRVLCRVAGMLHRCQERHYRVGDGNRGAPGRVMTRALDELQASVRQGPGEPAPGIEGNQGVLRVGEQEYRRLDRRDGGLQLIQFAQQDALLCQEGTPQWAVLAARMSPDGPS